MSMDMGELKSRATLDIQPFLQAVQRLDQTLSRLDQNLSQVRQVKVDSDRQSIDRLKEQFGSLSAALSTLSGAKLGFDPGPALDALEAIMKGAVSVSGALFGLGAAATGVVAGLAAAGAKAAAELQHNVAAVRSITQEIRPSEVFNELSQMQTRVAQSSSQLAKALYDVFSSINVTQEQALKLVEQFAKGAVAAQTDVQSFGTAIIGVLNAYKLSVEEAARISDIFFNTVNAGVVTGQELAHELGPVTAAAKNAGVSFEELGAMIAGVTKEGGPAAQNINNLVNFLSKITTKEVVAELEQLGITVEDESGRIRPMLDILTDLKAHLESLPPAARALAVQQIFPDLQARQGAQVLISQLEFVRNQLEINRREAGATEEAYRIMSQTAQSQAQLFGNAWNALLEEIGSAVLPGLTKFAESGATTLRLMRESIQQTSGDIQRAAADSPSALDQLGQAIDELGVRVLVFAGRLDKLKRQGERNVQQAAVQAVTETGAAQQVAAFGAPVVQQILGLLGQAGTSAQELGAQLWNDFLKGLRDAAEAEGGQGIASAFLGLFDPGRLGRAIEPNIERFEQLLQTHGAEAALAYATGFQSVDLAIAAGQALDQQDQAIVEEISRLGALGVDAGQKLLEAWQRGLEIGAPGTIDKLNEITEQVAAGLRDVLANADTGEIGAEQMRQLLDGMEETLRQTFPGIPQIILDLIRVMVVERGRELFEQAGRESGEAFSEQVQQRLRIGVTTTVDEIAKAVKAKALDIDLRLKTSQNVEEIEKILEYKDAVEKAQKAVQELTDKGIAAYVQAQLNAGNVTEAAAVGEAHLEAQRRSQQAVLSEQIALTNTLEERSKQLVNTIVQGSDAATAAWVEFVSQSASQGQILEALYGQLGIDASRLPAILQGSARQVAEEIRRLQALLEFRETGRLQPAPTQPDAFQIFAQQMQQAQQSLRQAEEQAEESIREAQETLQRALRDIEESLNQAQTDLAKALSDLSDQWAEAEAAAAAALAEVDRQLQKTLQRIAEQEEKLESEFARSTAEQERQFIEGHQDRLRQYREAVIEANKQLNTTLSQTIEQQRNLWIQSTQQLAELQRQASEQTAQHALRLEDIRQKMLAATRPEEISKLAAEKIRIEAEIGFREVATQAQIRRASAAARSRAEELQEQSLRVAFAQFEQLRKLEQRFREDNARAIAEFQRQRAEALRRHEEQLRELQKQRKQAEEEAAERRREIAERLEKEKERIEKARKQAQERFKEAKKEAEEARKQAKERYEKTLKQIEESRREARERAQKQQKLAWQQLQAARKQVEFAERIANRLEKLPTTVQIQMDRPVLQETSVDLLELIVEDVRDEMREGVG